MKIPPRQICRCALIIPALISATRVQNRVKKTKKAERVFLTILCYFQTMKLSYVTLSTHHTLRFLKQYSADQATQV
jgi:hypothetical protein